MAKRAKTSPAPASASPRDRIPPGPNRPRETKFNQQRFPGSTPTCCNSWGFIVALMVVLSILHAVSGALLLLNTWAVETAGVKYGCWRAEGAAEHPCESACVPVAGAPGVCAVDIEVQWEMRAPVMLMYQLDGFFQGHRKYAKSASMDEFQGDAIDASDREDDCRGYTSNATGPCGLRPSSRFTDRVVLLSPSGAVVPIDRLATTRAWSSKAFAVGFAAAGADANRSAPLPSAYGYNASVAPRLQSSALTDASPAARAARCDYTAPHMQSAETACAVFLEAGYTCETTWWQICGIDHPDGAEYNSNALKMAGCPDSWCSQCATEEPGSGAYASGEVDGASVRAFDASLYMPLLSPMGAAEEEARLVSWMRNSPFATRKALGRINETLAPGTYTFLVRDAYDVSFFRGSKSLILSTAEHGLGGRHTGLGSVALTVAAMCIVFSIWVGAAAFLGPLNKRCDALELEVVAEEEKHLRETQEMHAAMDLLQRTSFESSAGGGGGSDFRGSDFAAEADAEGEAPSELVAHAVAGGVEERKWREEERHIAEEERRQEEEAHEAEVKALREEAEERQRERDERERRRAERRQKREKLKTAGATVAAAERMHRKRGGDHGGGGRHHGAEEGAPAEEGESFADGRRRRGTGGHRRGSSQGEVGGGGERSEGRSHHHRSEGRHRSDSGEGRHRERGDSDPQSHRHRHGSSHGHRRSTEEPRSHRHHRNGGSGGDGRRTDGDGRRTDGNGESRGPSRSNSRHRRTGDDDEVRL